MNSIPNKFSTFRICGNYPKLYSWSFLFYELREAASRSITKFSIWCMKINKEEFCSLVKASKFVDECWFSQCKILTDLEWKFGSMEGTNIKELNLLESGFESKWLDYPERCINIIKGIVNCPSLAISLSEITLINPDIHVKLKELVFEDISNLFKANNFQIPRITFKYKYME